MKKTRLEILKVHTKGMPIKDVDLKELAKKLRDFPVPPAWKEASSSKMLWDQWLQRNIPVNITRKPK
jgi:SpoVK/Ycf46/Vps4 family AAA+-type ATPase